MAKILYVINVMLHENAPVKKIKNEQIREVVKTIIHARDPPE